MDVSATVVFRGRRHVIAVDAMQGGVIVLEDDIRFPFEHQMNDSFVGVRGNAERFF